MWKCPTCGEKHDDAFEVCWNCGTFIDGRRTPNFEREQGPEESRGGSTTSAGPGPSCSRCGSNNVMQNVEVLDRDHGGTQELSVQVNKNPLALIFRGRTYGTLRAEICSQCGHAELYVADPQQLAALWDAYQASRNLDGR